jgi:hypothetical protein
MNNNLLYAIYTNYFYKNNSKIINNSIIDKNNNDISVEYHLIGIYDKSLKIWYNAWALNNFNSKEIKISKLLLDHLLNSDIEYNIKKNSLLIIKSIMCNSKIYITEYKTQLELILAIFIYYTRNDFIHNVKSGNLYYYYAYK